MIGIRQIMVNPIEIADDWWHKCLWAQNWHQKLLLSLIFLLLKGYVCLYKSHIGEYQIKTGACFGWNIKGEWQIK